MRERRSFTDIFCFHLSNAILLLPKKMIKVCPVCIVLLTLFICTFSFAASNVSIAPSDMLLPGSPGGLFRFDFVISNPEGVFAQGFQTTISVSGPGILTFDGTSSQAVATVVDYWIYGNSAGAAADDLGNNTYRFGDGPDNGVAQALAADDIVARYAFTWDGTQGDYTFALDLDTRKSFVLDQFFSKQALQFTPEPYSGDSRSFTVHIPEPVTLLFLSLGAVILCRRRRI